jgi:RNA polymerase sigma factor (sigma-70 family)
VSDALDVDQHAAAIAAGDAGAFARALAVIEPSVRASLRSYAAKVDVEAVVQEALLRLWQVAPRFVPDGRPHGLIRFATRIAHNLAIDELRRRRELPSEAAALDEASARTISAESFALAAPDPMLRARIVFCYEQLPPKNALAMHARIEARGGDSDTAIAEQLGMRLNTFLQNVTRARKLLERCLEEQGVALGTEAP